MTTTPNQPQPPKAPNEWLKGLIYAVGAFCVFMALTYVLRLVTGKFPEKTVLFGVYQSTDLWLGAAVAVILAYSRRLKRNIGNKDNQ